MKKNFDLRKEWEKTKKQLEKISKEAMIVAKKGEDELVKFSKKGKLHLDSTAIGLKIEQLYYTIGKEYVRAKNSSKTSSKLDSLVTQIKNLEKDQKALKSKIRRGAPAAKKTSKRK